MGVVELSRKRVRRNMFMVMTITTFLVLMVSLTFFGTGGEIVEVVNPRWVITGIIFLIYISVAYFLKFQGMYLYAFIIAGAFNFSEMIMEHPGFVSDNSVAYFIASSFLIAIGIYYFIGFLKKYSLPE